MPKYTNQQCEAVAAGNGLRCQRGIGPNREPGTKYCKQHTRILAQHALTTTAFTRPPADYNRGTGRTTKAMQAAPQGAIYIWCNSSIYYARSLARQLGRKDLVICAPSMLEGYQLRGTRVPAVIVDHAAQLTDKQHAALFELQQYLGRYNNA